MNYTYQELLDRMTDLELLAVPPEAGEKGGNFSSFDRRSRYDARQDVYYEWGANNDCDGYIRMEGDRLVAFEMEGPGVIWRFWSADPQEGNIRIYTEDRKKEKMAMPFRKWFERYAVEEGKTEWPANFPNLMPILSRGRNRFIPIPFNDYCKITIDPGWGAFYHITYTKFPCGTRLPEYSLSLEREVQIPLAILDRKLHLRGKGRMEEGKITEINLECEGEEESIIMEDDRPQAIQCIQFIEQTGEGWKNAQDVILKIWWDGEVEESVSCSLASFLGITEESDDYRAWPVSVINETGTSFWYMPCRSLKIKIRNQGRTRISYRIKIRRTEIEREKADCLMRFHAIEHGTEFHGLDRKRFLPDGDRWPDWPFLLCEGKGRFCGIHLVIDNRFRKPDVEADEWWYGIAGHKSIDWWWGEGDEKFFVDNEKFPSTFGTGSEDYVGYAWAAEPPHVLFDSAYAVQNAVPIDGNGTTSLLRFHICDNVPFQHKFEGFIEKYRENGWAEDAVCEYMATPFWYVMHDGKQKDYYTKAMSLS